MDNVISGITNYLIFSPFSESKKEETNYIVECNRKDLTQKKKKRYYQVNNKISTSRYTWYNCFPKIIFEQFSKMSNIYFLVIAILQCYKEISNADGKPIILMPLLIVVSINGIKDFYEDWKRKKSDDDENNREILIFNSDLVKFEKKKWKDVTKGSIIKVNNNEFFPADCVLLNSSDKNHNCFVETKNLDGETNLKFKKSIKKFIDLTSNLNNLNLLLNIKGELVTKQPNEYIYEFNGYFNFDEDIIENDDNNNYHNTDTNEEEIKNSDLIEETLSINSGRVNQNNDIKKINYNKNIVSIEIDSFLLRGCSLKQTDFIYALVVYVGHETKIMKNSPNARTKISSIEGIMNEQIIFIFVFQLILGLVAACFSVYILNSTEYNRIPYINKSKSYGLKYFLLRLGTWIVLLNNLVPISLLVTMEMVKYIQGFFISWDCQIYDKTNKQMAKVQTSTLNEELGQVKYIFSDKTGTLTKNYMEFKKMSIGNKSYGDIRDENLNFEFKFNDDYGEITNINIYDKEIFNDFNKNNNELLDLFFTCLSTCHSVLIDDNKFENEKKIVYQGSSPDEVAFVNCARYYKYIFSGRDIDNNIFILDQNNNKKAYKQLIQFEYSSERKRMSVILKCPDNKIRLFIKGADNVISERLNNEDRNISFINKKILDYAHEGLRTLMIAYKEIDEETYKLIYKEYKKAQINTYLKNKMLNILADKVEDNLILLGITGIEDELQDELDEVLESFIEAGIKVWVLTGDKKETAKSIAYSCKLINDENFTIFEFEENSTIKTLTFQINNYIKNYNSFYENNIINNNNENLSNKKFAIIISQNELNLITEDSTLQNAFYELSMRCNSIICSRVTPIQKAKMVNLIKNRENNITTLAIGDGANDVNMITAAHIGVGIMGIEGKQAARASDYAIGQFKSLKRLLFFHGRESYRKNSFIVCYNFYKNFLFVIPQFLLGFDSLFSGQTIYEPWIYQFYNIAFAAYPIIWFGIYDQQFKDTTFMNNPHYYRQGIYGKLFGYKRFWKWIFYGFSQAIVLYIFTFKMVLQPYNLNGDTQDLKLAGTICYSAVVIIVNVKVIQTTYNYTFIGFFLVLISVVSYYVFVFFMSKYPNFYNFGNFDKMVYQNVYYLKMFCIILICIAMDLGINMVIKFCGCERDFRTLSEEEFKKINLVNDSIINVEIKKKHHIEEIELEEIDINI